MRSLGRTGLLSSGSLLLGSLVFLGSLHAQTYTATDLGTLGGSNSAAWGISESGLVTGVSATSIWAESHAFLSDGITMTDLGIVGENSAGYDVDGLGRTAGYFYVSGKTLSHAFLSAGGAMSDLGTLAAASDPSLGLASNPFGDVVGVSTTSLGEMHAVLWLDGSIQDLGTLPGANGSAAVDVNDRKSVVGSSWLDGSTGGWSRPFVWDATNGMRHLGTLGGDSSAAALNERGQVVGTYEPVGGSGSAVFLWDGASGMRDLGTFAPGNWTYANDLNDGGAIVGTSLDGSADYRAVLWDGSAWIDLNTRLDAPSAWKLEGATAINEAGQIACCGSWNQQTHAFLLTPSGCLALVQPIGSMMGGTLSFRHRSPCHPGALAVTLVSMTGGSGSVALSSGASIALDADLLTYVLLANPQLAVVALDGMGRGETAAIPLPDNSLLVGQALWAASAVLESGHGVVSASPTVAFEIY